MTNAPSNQTYSNSTYAVQDSSSSTAANAYGYAAVSNPWGAYAAAAQNVSVIISGTHYKAIPYS